ncbi:Sodium-driven chloride bicarbonate exchanger, partial [Lemmus lemmus]
NALCTCTVVRCTLYKYPGVGSDSGLLGIALTGPRIQGSPCKTWPAARVSRSHVTVVSWSVQLPLASELPDPNTKLSECRAEWKTPKTPQSKVLLPEALQNMDIKDQGAQMEPLLPTRNDEEAVVDRGGTRSILKTHFEKEDLEGHRTLFIGVHVPLGGRKSHRRHRHRGHKHRKRDRERDSGLEDGRESPSFDTPSQRVQFILGTEDDDEEHIPHDLFTELDEICWREGEDAEWRETARWLKFEEDVEDGGERWSKPYVATLSLHSLFELRSCVLNGTVLLDMHANTLEEIADMVLDQQVSSGQLNEDVRHRVHEALMKQHHHQSQKKLTNRIPIVRSFADIGKKQSEPNSMGQVVSPQSAPACAENKNDVSRENSTVDFSKVDLHFMKKIPPGAEASNILVGELEFLDRTVVAFVRLSPAVLLQGLAEVPIPSRFLFILLGPLGKGQQYHEIGRSIATLMTDEVFHDVAYKAKDRNDLVSGIDEFLDQVTVLPPGEWDPSIRIEPPKNVPSQEKRKIPAVPNGTAALGEAEPHGGHSGPELQRTGRIFGGLILDIKRKAPFFWSDFRDAFSLQCLASFLFLYCACMSPVITFGGLLGEATEGRISAIESLFGASMTGIAYSLFGGQPLTILGSTGPVLVFEKILFKFCKEYGLSYLSLRASIGLWTATLCIILVATDASSLVCYITRFTEEAFASLICIIFIYEALEKLFELSEAYPINMHNDLELLTQYSCNCMEPHSPSNDTLKEWRESNISASDIIWGNLSVSECRSLHGEYVGRACGHGHPYVPDVLFWSVILFFSTVTMSATLKQFKTSRYFPTKVRSIVSDFAVFLTILCMVLIDYAIGIPSPKLKVPSVFKPTRDDRGWFVTPLGPNPWWTIIAAIIPALLCTILIFMDQQITALFDRIKLFWMPAKHQPDFIYLRHVPLRKVHLFTIIQMSCLGLLWIIKVSRAAIVFPMMVLALVFVRKLMDFLFTKRELSWLDDLMPESKKKKLEDAEKEEEQSMLAMEDEGTVQLPLEGHYRDDPSVINISDEMSKTAMWGNLLVTADNSKDKESRFPSKRTYR